ncbi:MAG: hypothetical protein SH847_17530 [Roseiflexaceae bacterium]|nr:hypothetical protein [Roseiflexaceae bacterium]
MTTLAQKGTAPEQTPAAPSAVLNGDQVGQHQQMHSILGLQRAIGNQAVQRQLNTRSGHTTGDLAAYQIGGLKPGADIDDSEVGIGGTTVGESIGDIARPVGSALGNLVGSVAGALTGISISSNTNVGPTWSDHGQFLWQVGFSTTGTDGWIVQKIVNTMRADDASGNQAPGWRPTPEYWEAWAVDGSSTVTPNIGADNDYWTRPSKGSGTEGHWSMTGSVYFTTTDPTTQGFTSGGVADAGILLSSTTAPSDLGIARLTRYAQGTWDSTGATPTHTGSAN